MSSLRGADAKTDLLGRLLYPANERDARPWIVREEKVPVEVDVIDEARDVGRGSDPESRLDHAAEHDAKAERARGVHHAHRLANTAGLRELDRDSVAALGTRGDVGEGMTVLVEEDRHR